MKLRILGHACVEIEADGTTLLCDPWLVGSAYWRSWWNFPPTPPGLVDTLHPDFVYLTHLHWDHFHGPTLRRLGQERKILVPKTPDRRIIKDLQTMGFKKIEELPHGRRTRLSDSLFVTSYQIGPFADSALVIEADSTVILNANDAKFMGLPLVQILSKHPRIDFALRSHSSANSRLCYEFTDAPGAAFDDPYKYSKEFADFCLSVRPKYAIPFASNHCFLHDETVRFNSTVNFSHKVAEYFVRSGIETPRCVAMVPGDSWDSSAGFSLAAAPIDVEASIAAYREQKQAILARQVEKENVSVLAVKGVRNYLSRVIADTPWLIRRLFKKKPIVIVADSKAGARALRVDVHKNDVSEIPISEALDAPIRIHACALIINDCCKTRNWNSLGISKRVRFVSTRKEATILRLFNYVLNAHEYEVFPLSAAMNARFIGVWARRWRELFLYAHIAWNVLLRRKLEQNDYLPRAAGLDQSSPAQPAE